MVFNTIFMVHKGSRKLSAEAEVYAVELRAIFAKNLKRGRLEFDLTRQDLARKAEVGKKVIWGIERGATYPSLLTLAKLSCAIGTDLPTLLQGKTASGRAG
jgi:transcriptional regulator with XRE-family HTH domain